MTMSSRVLLTGALLTLLTCAASVHGAPRPVFLNAKDAGPDFAVQGEYEGTIGDEKSGIQVIALGSGRFAAVVYAHGLPGAGWDGKSKTHHTGNTRDGETSFSGDGFKGTIKEDAFTGTASNDAKIRLRKVERTSPTLGERPPAGAVVLFDGTNTDAWKVGKIAEGNLLGVEAITKDSFGDCRLHVEFRTPFMPTSRGQGRANSGVYLMDQYELQVLDSFGLKGLDNECGGFYKAAAPQVNMCLPPLSWQTYDIDFRAPRFAADGKTKQTNAIITVRQNGVVIHDKLEMKGPTPGGHRNDEHPGPIFLQNHGNPVRFKNIWIVQQH